MVTGMISRVLCLVVLLAVAAASCGCMVVEMNAPYGPDIEVLPADVPVEVSRRYQKWYIFWGVFSVSGDDPRRVIIEERLVEARISTADSLEDMFSGAIFFLFFPMVFGIFVPQTVVVEGNRLSLDERGIAVESEEPKAAPADTVVPVEKE